jgi:hypothetical protein
MTNTPITELHAAFEAAHRNKDRMRNDALQKEISRCQSAALDAFAVLNGWTLVTSSKGFVMWTEPAPLSGRTRFFAISSKIEPWSFDVEPGTMRSLLDHRRNFRCGEHAVAILGQPYAPWTPDDLPRLWGKLDGSDEVELAWRHPAALLASPYYPLATSVILLARPETPVQWLPEQMDVERWRRPDSSANMSRSASKPQNSPEAENEASVSLQLQRYARQPQCLSKG